MRGRRSSLGSKSHDLSKLSVSNLPYGSLLEFIGVKDKTLRTWLRKFPEVGERQSNGKLLFSPFDAITLRTFAELVTKLYMQPAVAAKIANESLEYMRGQLAKDVNKAEGTLYFVISDASLDDPDIDIFDSKGLSDHLLLAGMQLSPFTVIPVDIGMMSLHTLVIKMRDSARQAFEELIESGGKGEKIDSDRLHRTEKNVEATSQALKHMMAMRDKLTPDITDEDKADLEKLRKEQKSKKQ